jgi:UDP-glucose 4-epimerase
VAGDSKQDIAKVLITGGAGFIGSTVASACLDRGITPVILDNLVTGRREFTSGRIFFEGDIADGALIDKVFAEHPDIGAVVHCAALIVVPDSVADPLGYYRANVVKSLDMVEHLLRNGCQRLLFSSSAAIYSPGADLSVDENSPLGPTSPYAQSKVVCEQMFADIAAAEPLRMMSLRYFNPIGADPQLRTGLQVREPTHALGRLILAMQAGEPFRVTGTDYPTRDGTGIRDYVHVWDLAEAHLAALSAFDRVLSGRTSTVVNLGTGTGTTVRELVTAFNRVSGTPVATIDAPRRPGDAAGAFTRSDRAAAALGWRTRFSMADGIRDALRWIEVRDVILGGGAAH